MVKLMNKAIDEVINTIINSSDYKSCVEVKEKMSSNEELVSLINKIKSLQKKYVNTDDENILKELNKLEEELNSIPIYVIYMQHLEKVNEMINLVNDELNNYFYDVLNK